MRLQEPATVQWEPTLRIDSLGLKVGKQLSFSLDAQNLNDPILKYYGDTKDEPRAIYRNGRQFYVAAHFKY